MKKTIFALFIALSFLCNSNAEPPGLTNVVEIQCVKISKGDQFIFTNKAVRIEMAKADFISSLNEWIEEHDFDRDKKLLKLLRESKGNVHFHDLDRTLQSRAEFRISDLLQIGKVKLFNSKKNNYADVFLFGEWGFQTAPLCGAGGKVFFLKEEEHIEFFKVTEWVS